MLSINFKCFFNFFSHDGLKSQVIKPFLAIIHVYSSIYKFRGLAKKDYFYTMGKPSLKSRKLSRIRKKIRKIRMIKELKEKEEEVSDLQIQMQDFKKSVFDSGKSLLNNLEQCSRENNNLVEWLKLYDKQMKDYEKEIYDLNLRLYFSQHHQQTQMQLQSSHQLQQSQHQPQSPTFRSLADYFKSQKS